MFLESLPAVASSRARNGDTSYIAAAQRSANSPAMRNAATVYYLRIIYCEGKRILLADKAKAPRPYTVSTRMRVLGSPQLGFQKSRGPTRWDCYSHPQGGPGCTPYSEIKQGPHEVGLRARRLLCRKRHRKSAMVPSRTLCWGRHRGVSHLSKQDLGADLPEFCH